MRLLALFMLCGAVIAVHAQTIHSNAYHKILQLKQGPPVLSASLLQSLSGPSLKYINTEYFQWDMDSNGTKQGYTNHIKNRYDKNGNQLSSTTYQWTGNWTNFSYDTFFYINGIYAGFTEKLWDNGAGAWANSTGFSIATDSKRHIVTSTNLVFHSGWDSSTRFIQYSSPTGHDSILVIQDWVNSGWQYNLTDTMTNGAGGRLAKEIFYGYLPFLHSFACNGKTINNYDKKGIKRSSQNYGYSRSTGVFYPNGKDTFIYDANGNLTTHNNYLRNLSGTYDPFYRDVYSYDPRNNQTSYIDYAFYNGRAARNGKTLDGYDANNNKLKEQVFAYDTSNNFTNGIYTEFSYSGISGIENNSGEAGGISIFPNPTSDQINIHYTPKSYTRILLVNAQGQTLYCSFYTPGETQKTISLSKWPAGIYTLSLTTEDSIIIKKIIKL